MKILLYTYYAVSLIVAMLGLGITIQIIDDMLFGERRRRKYNAMLMERQKRQLEFMYKMGR